MKAAVIERQGGVENIAYREFSDPETGPDDIKVRIHACGLNYFDIFVRRGMPGLPVRMPHISGGDIAGEVAGFGSKVTGWTIGERVLVDPLTNEGMLGETIQGGMAQYCRVPQEFAIKLDPRLTFEQAASIPANYGTAFRMLITNGRVEEGESVLILGASGGVGTAAVQVAKLQGARVIACASTDDKCRRLKEMGADEVINYSTHNFSHEAWAMTAKKGVDVVVNFTGGATWVSSLRALSRRGRLLTCGATAGYNPETDIRLIWDRELRIIGSNGYTKEDVTKGMMGVAEGKLKIPQIRTFPLQKLADAETAMEARDFFGKIVMLVP